MAEPFDPNQDPRQFTCDTIRWTSVGGDMATAANGTRLARHSVGRPNLDKKIWPLVSDSRPTTDVSWVFGEMNLGETANEVSLPTQEFEVTGKNNFGTTIFDIRFRVSIRTAGQPAAAAATLRRCSIAIVTLAVAWGWHLDFNAEVNDLIECGEPGATFEVLPVNLVVRLGSKLKQEQSSHVFLLSGNGAAIEPMPVEGLHYR